jgi:ankyrin repeat protein
MSLHEDAFKGTLTQSSLNRYRSVLGFDINALDSRRGMTALSTAAFKGQTEVVRVLLENDASAKTLSRGDRTPLWFAATGSMHSRERAEIIQMLIATQDVDLNAPSPQNGQMTPLMKVVVEWRDPAVISQLIDAGASRTQENAKKETAQTLADKTKDTAVIHALRPRSERMASRSEFITLMVKFVLFVILWVIGNDTTGIANDVIKDMYRISGQKAPEIEKVSECV